MVCFKNFSYNNIFLILISIKMNLLNVEKNCIGVLSILL